MGAFFGAWIQLKTGSARAKQKAMQVREFWGMNFARRTTAVAVATRENDGAAATKGIRSAGKIFSVTMAPASFKIKL